MAKQLTKAKRPTRKPAGRAAKMPDRTAADVAAAVMSLGGAISADRLGDLSPELLQKLIAAAIRAYSAKVQAGERFLPFHPRAGRVSPTDVMITASALLKAADLQVFELGMWQSYTGR
jgi:hypothetical protein